MEFIKKFSKEISVFGLVIVIFLGLFAYRQMTFKNYKTVSESKLTDMVKSGDDFIVVVGDSTNNTVIAYQNVMAKYTTKNRSTSLYYLDTSKLKDDVKYVKDTFDTNVSYPATLIVKNGKVTAKKEGALQYYSLYDFIKENN